MQCILQDLPNAHREHPLLFTAVTLLTLEILDCLFSISRDSFSMTISST